MRDLRPQGFKVTGRCPVPSPKDISLGEPVGDMLRISLNIFNCNVKYVAICGVYGVRPQVALR